MMNKTITGLSAIALATALAACGQGGEPTENVAVNDMNAAMADASDPFAQSEMSMDQAINAAVGVNAADSWVRKMIAHHKGAVEMSRIVLAQNPSADVAMMAQQTIDKQTKEIADLEKLIAAGAPDPGSAELYRASTMQMREAMMAAKGSDISETFLRKMLAHHQGAVAMSDVALANGAAGPVRTQIEKTKADQQKEIAMVEAMLRGEPMHSATPAPSPSATTKVAPATSKPEQKKAVTTPEKAKPAAPKSAEPKPADPNCAPEHRAAGHC